MVFVFMSVFFSFLVQQHAKCCWQLAHYDYDNLPLRLQNKLQHSSCNSFNFIAEMKWALNKSLLWLDVKTLFPNFRLKAKTWSAQRNLNTRRICSSYCMVQQRRDRHKLKEHLKTALISRFISNVTCLSITPFQRMFGSGITTIKYDKLAGKLRFSLWPPFRKLMYS